MLAFLFLPRQWQVAVVENVDERHLNTATWMFPLYLLLINIFVLPIALAGLVTFGSGGVSPDTFVLALPMADQQAMLALFAFLGGLSAATGMVIVETIALATMVSNSLVLPVLLRRRSALADGRDLGRTILGIRRSTIVAVLLLAYGYVLVAGDAPGLVSIGLVSFAAVAQFAPAVLGGMVWRGGTRRGATWGLLAGFVIWAYTLLLPSFAATGLVPESLVDDGPFGIGLLAPHQLLGLHGLDEFSHAMFWSMLVNTGLYVGLSLTGRRARRARQPPVRRRAHPRTEAARTPGSGVARLRSRNCRCCSSASSATTAPGQRSSPTPRAPARDRLGRRRRGARTRPARRDAARRCGGFRVRAGHRRLTSSTRNRSASTR